MSVASRNSRFKGSDQDKGGHIKPQQEDQVIAMDLTGAHSLRPYNFWNIMVV